MEKREKTEEIVRVIRYLRKKIIGSLDVITALLIIIIIEQAVLIYYLFRLFGLPH